MRGHIRNDVRKARESRYSRACQHRHHTDNGRQEHTGASFAQANVFGAFNEHVDNAYVLKARCKERRHKDEPHRARKNAAHALKHCKAQIKRLLGVASHDQIHKEGKHPSDEHGRSHIERDALVHHFVEDQQKHDRNNRQHGVYRRNIFQHLALFFEFLQIGRFALDVVVLVKPILNHHMSNSHRQNRGHGHRQLVLHQILDGIKMHELGRHHRHTGGRRITDCQHTCNHGCCGKA